MGKISDIYAQYYTVGYATTLCERYTPEAFPAVHGKPRSLCDLNTPLDTSKIQSLHI